MSKYVPDILSRRWVILSPQRLSRPENNHKSKKTCPFCPGKESETPPEVLRFGKGEPNKPGWLVRVIPNRFPITDFHEVFIHTPSCRLELETLPLPHLELIFKAYRDRFNFYRKKGQVLIFCNHREHAGATLKHSHSQLVVLPFQINLDTLTREPKTNVVEETKNFFVYCPEFSQWPYEFWLAPKKEGTMFGDITDEEITESTIILQNNLRNLKKIYQRHHIVNIPFSYNFYIYPKESWYLRVIPRLVYRAGFELGTGLLVNIVDPIDAAAELKGKDSRVEDLLNKHKEKSK